MKVYTTTTAAKVLQVARKTVTRWFDEGRVKGYQLPKSGDRRIPEKCLKEFMEREGFPMSLLEEK